MQLQAWNKRRLELDREARQIKTKCDALSKVIIGALNDGDQVELGIYTAEVASGGRYPKWKEAFIERLGQVVADEVIANTPFTEVLNVEMVGDD